jgi:hypothetical protein
MFYANMFSVSQENPIVLRNKTVYCHAVNSPAPVSELSQMNPVHAIKFYYFTCHFNPLKPEINPSAQRCLKRYFTSDFVSRTVHLINIRVKSQKMQQLFIQFINYIW